MTGMFWECVCGMSSVSVFVVFRVLFVMFIIGILVKPLWVMSVFIYQLKICHV